MEKEFIWRNANATTMHHFYQAMGYRPLGWSINPNFGVIYHAAFRKNTEAAND